MKCTEKQTQRLRQLLNDLNIYTSAIDFDDGTISVHTGHAYCLNSFDNAMDVIMELSSLDPGQDADDLAGSVEEILAQNSEL